MKEVCDFEVCFVKVIVVLLFEMMIKFFINLFIVICLFKFKNINDEFGNFCVYEFLFMV